jgi:hypothetical protein
MIDIELVNELEEKQLKIRIKKEQEDQQKRNKELEANRLANIEKTIAARKKAEEVFPEALKRIEADIKEAIANRRRKIIFYCSYICR